MIWFIIYAVFMFVWMSKVAWKLEDEYRKRPDIRVMFPKHTRGVDIEGQHFVYCPVHQIVSWYVEDYKHQWCHACQKFFGEMDQ